MSERSLQDDIRHTRAYLAGLRAGWNMGVANERERFSDVELSLLAELRNVALERDGLIGATRSPISNNKGK